MVSVMSDLERNEASSSEEKDARVSNDGGDVHADTREKSVDDLTLNEETRVSSDHDLGTSKSESEETRVSIEHYLGESKSEFEEIRVSAEDDLGASKNEIEETKDSSEYYFSTSKSDNEVAGVCDKNRASFNLTVELGGEECIDAQNEAVASEAVVGSSEDIVQGSGSSSNDGKHLSNVDIGEVQMDGTIGEYRLESRRDLWVSESSGVGASDMNIVRTTSTRVSGTGYEMGDMVWGKVKSHPWWPGHVFSEALAFSSVRRTRREGHVLVAFFGDSSYGWFDKSDLIPYDPHFDEKSQQTNSRNFMRAVEESVDEVSRRTALGLSCRCRNPYNFRPAKIPGYMAVDVLDYEPDALYSASQIKSARESFQPAVTLSFIKQFAAAPGSGESKSLDFIKYKATALAYRRSIYEEFDETYAQAFGHDPVQSSEMPQPQPDIESHRVPLSGPIVIPEAHGSHKSSNKATKPKDKYLLKRRDETGDLRMSRANQVHASSLLPSAYQERTLDSAAASYMLQKRDHPVVAGDELGRNNRNQVATSAPHATTDVSSAGHCVGPDVSANRFSLGAISSLQQSESSAPIEVTNVYGKVPDKHISNITSANDGLVKKKKKVAKRPAGEQISEKSNISEKKKKKFKQTDGERSMEHLERPSFESGGTYLVKSEGRSMQIAASSRLNTQTGDSNQGNEVSYSAPRLGSSSPETARELHQMLDDLQGLALNPFHDAEMKKRALTRKMLKFRSLVFLKASSASSTAESDLRDVRTNKFPNAAEPLTEDSKTVPSLKSSKFSATPEDMMKGGRKRLPSERQEELSAKRLKKINKVKALGAEKRTLLKNPEMPRSEGKAKISAAQQPSSKPIKPEQQSKQMDRPPRVEEPTYLLMKFQSGSSLPSLVELKARFARFGPLDTSLSRVFYTTSSCRVAFLYKQDANVAYRYAVGSKALFSNVKFMLKPVAGPESQQSTSGRSEELPVDPPPNSELSAIEPQDTVPATPPVHQQTVQQLKSILKRPVEGDEPMGPTNGADMVRTPRVRFNMGEEESGASNRGVEMQMESRNVVSLPEDGPSSSSTVIMNVVSNNQRFTSSVQMQPPPLPYLSQFPRPSINHPQHHVQVSQRNNINYNLTSTSGLPGLAHTPQISSSLAPAPPPPSMDISQQMMTLLTRCHDVVTNVRSILGYVPYRPL